MAMLSQNVKNLKFMKNKKTENEKVVEKTFSYYACRNVILSYSNDMNTSKGQSTKYFDKTR